MVCPEGEGGGSGGGSGGGNEPYRNVTALTTWSPYGAGNWYVQSTESFVGSQIGDLPSTGYFTGVNHESDMMTAHPSLNMVWTKTGVTTNIAPTGRNAVVVISGRINHNAQNPSNSWTINISEPGVFGYTSLTWY